MIFFLTKNVHLSIYVTIDKTHAFGMGADTYIESLWPFRGFWLSANLLLSKLTILVYLGE
jgi:hypothetical protein